MNDLTTKLGEAVAEMVEEALNEKLQNLDLSDEAENAVEEAAREHNYDDAIERAAENYNFDNVIEEALRNYDLSDEAEEAVNKIMDDLDVEEVLGEKIGEVIDAQLEEKLPAAIEKHFTKLLERPDFAEKLVSLLFDRAAA